MRRIKPFLNGILPFLTLMFMMGGIFPLAIPAALVLAYAHAARVSRKEAGRAPGFWISAGAAARVVLCLLILFISLRLTIPFYPAVLAIGFAVAFLPAAAKKMKPETSAVLFLNLTVFLVFLLFTPPGRNDIALKKLEKEKFARPVYLFAEPGRNPGRAGKSPFDGVRSIVTDAQERAVFFTADGASIKRDGCPEFHGIFRVDLNDTSNVKSYSDTRLFGLAFTPDGRRLLATDYYRKKLLIFDPQTLRLKGSRATPAYPQFIIVDPRGNRVTVTHEVPGVVSIYELPRLQHIHDGRIPAAPAKVAVDLGTRTFFAANWTYPFLLSEIEIYSLRPRHRKFFLSFASGGVDIDRARNRVFVSNGLSGHVFGVDRATFKVTDRLKAKPLVRPVCVDGRRKLIYVGNVAEPRLRVFDFRGRQVASFFVGASCRDIVLTPKSHRVLAGTVLGLIEIDIDAFLRKNHAL